METTQAYVVVERYQRPDNNTEEQDYWLGPYSHDVAREVAADYTRETGVPARVVRVWDR